MNTREKKKEEEGQSISSFLQQKRNIRLGVQDGTLVMNATMKDGTLIFQRERMANTRKGPVVSN